MDYEMFRYQNASDTFIITHRKALSHHMPAQHFHSTYELYYLVSGERRFFIKDRILEIREGELVLIHPNVLHRTTNAEMPKHERIIINFHEDFLMRQKSLSVHPLDSLLEEEFTAIRFSPSHRSIYAEELLRKMLQEVQEEKTGFEIYVQTLLLQLLIDLSRYLEENQLKPQPYNSPVHDRMTEIVRYINENYTRNITLPNLAERFYISPYYLSRAFKETTGFSFVEYLNTVRIKEAIKLLKGSRLKVNKIAEKTGFGSITHFGRVFKQITGHPPLYYRKP